MEKNRSHRNLNVKTTDPSRRFPNIHTAPRRSRFRRCSLAFAFAFAAATSFAQSNAPSSVTCLGRIDPELIHVMPPASTFPVPPPVQEILVQQGSRVTNGQVIAILENKERLETTARACLAEVRLAELRLQRAKGPVHENEIAQQKAQVDRFEVEADLARKDFARSQDLQKGAAITDADFDRSRLSLAAREKALQSEQAKLTTLQQSGDIDIMIAEAELQSAQAQAQHAQAEMQQAIVRAPIDGLIAKVHVKRGERPDAEGVAELVQTDPMFVTAEVYETDVRYVQRGQRAEITSPAAPDTLTGVVESIGFKVGRNRILDNDPASVADARVVEAKIKLDKNSWADRLIGARVRVRILR